MDKKRDDEKLFWFIGGGLFTAVLIAVDIWFSSFSLMKSQDNWLYIIVWVGHAAVLILWSIVLVKFTDPNYDYFRKLTVKLTAAVLIVVALHHAIVGENKRVLIDSEENKRRDSIEKAQYDSAYQTHSIPNK